jgi:hypothetical protein
MGFNKISKDLKVPVEATAVYTFYSFALCDAGPPQLTVRHAGDGTLGFKRAAWHSANAARARRGDNAISESRTEARCREEAKLIADHCVVGWSNVYDDGDPEPSPCTPAKVLEFLITIIEADEGVSVYVAFSNWAQDASNFRTVPQGDAVELGKA